MKRSVAMVGLACLLLSAGGGPLAGIESSPAPYAYHLRIVRVSGAETDPGAALAWSENGGIPVVLPDAEAWGSAAQIAALAETLGGTNADAVAGYYVMGDEAGAQFDRRVYLADSILDLSFTASPPSGARKEHLLELELDSPELTEPMAEARLLVRTQRTVAIASPSPLENDWLVLAVTLVDQGRIADLRQAKDELRSADDPDVVAPKVTHKIPPRYPEGARKDKVQGDVVVMTTIDKQGIPRAPMVVEMSAGAEELAAAAVDTVQEWRYEPATLNGEPVDVIMTVIVRFMLE